MHFLGHLPNYETFTNKTFFYFTELGTSLIKDEFAVYFFSIFFYFTAVFLNKVFNITPLTCIVSFSQRFSI